MNGLEDFFAYMSGHWHWLIALIICMMVSGAIKGAFESWSNHRLALAEAKGQAAAAGRMQMLQPPPGPSAAVPAKLVQCQHYAPNVTAVLNEVTGDREAWYCQACDTQLPANWALSAGDR